MSDLAVGNLRVIISQHNTPGCPASNVDIQIRSDDTFLPHIMPSPEDFKILAAWISAEADFKIKVNE